MDDKRKNIEANSKKIRVKPTVFTYNRQKSGQRSSDNKYGFEKQGQRPVER